MNLEPKDVLTVPVDSKGRITIPAEVRTELAIDENSIVEIALLGKIRGNETQSEKEVFAKEIYEMMTPLIDAMFEKDNMPKKDEQIALKRVEQRLEDEFK